MEDETREMFEFIEKCQRRQGKSFMEAFDLWLDLAPLRGGQVLDSGSSDHETSDVKTKPLSNLPYSRPTELLSVDEVCTFLGISRATLYRHDIPGKCKVGGQVRYARDELEKWLDKMQS